MIFYKSVASGNDFLHIDMEDFSIESPHKGELARRMCNRHTGPGADGVIYYKLKGQSVQFEIFNCDGSEAELSGNGMGGLAALMFYLERFRETAQMETKVGPRTHTLLQRLENSFRMNIQIGPADFNALNFFPFLEEGVDAYECGGTMFYPVSVGNPHAVVLLKEDPGDEELERTGAMLEQALMFPHKVNVEFVLPLDGSEPDYEKGDGFRIYFYERGVGRTLASSTGSAAVFAVLQKLLLLRRSLTIPAPTFETSSQTLKSIKITGKKDIFIENYVEIVYKGVYLKNQKK